MKRPAPRSSLALGLEWATRVTTIGLEFALPMLVGHGIDRGLGTLPAGTLVGLVLGLALGLFETLRLASRPPGGAAPSNPTGAAPEARMPEDDAARRADDGSLNN